jgi:hypothetical protein
MLYSFLMSLNPGGAFLEGEAPPSRPGNPSRPAPSRVEPERLENAGPDRGLCH